MNKILLAENKKEFGKNNTLALKGIAIIMMIFHHCFLYTQTFKGFDVSFFPFNQGTGVQLSQFFKICVSFFAFITGYGLMISYNKDIEDKGYSDKGKEVSKWTIKRLMKTLSGYWLIAILSLIICQLIDGSVTTELFKSGIMKGIFTTILNLLGLADFFRVPIMNSNWWYMSVAILFIISIPIFARIIKKYGGLISIILVIAIPRIIGWNYNANSYFSFLLPVVLGMVFAKNDFMLKIANYKLIKNKPILNKLIKFVISTILMIILYMVYNKMSKNQCWEIHHGIIPTFLIVYLYEFFIDLPILKNVLQFLGKHSMNIFLIHHFIRGVYLRDFIYSQRNWLAIAFILLSISLLISIIIEAFKKIVRYDKFINYITNRITGERKKEVGS